MYDCRVKLNKYMKNSEKPPKGDENLTESLSERFRKAYNKIAKSMRKQFLEDFARHHNITDRTAASKAGGRTAVTVWEVEWAEGYHPYTRTSTVVTTQAVIR